MKRLQSAGVYNYYFIIILLGRFAAFYITARTARKHGQGNTKRGQRFTQGRPPTLTLPIE